MSVSVEQRMIIEFLTAEGVQPLEILQRLEKQFGEACLSRSRVFEWCKTFREGRENIRADVFVRDNRRIIVQELASILNISVGSVETIVKIHLHYRKMNSHAHLPMKTK